MCRRDAFPTFNVAPPVRGEALEPLFLVNRDSDPKLGLCASFDGAQDERLVMELCHIV